MSPGRRRRRQLRGMRPVGLVTAIERAGKREWLRHLVGIKLAIAIGLLASSHPAISEYSWVVGLATNQLWLWRT